MTRAAIKAVPVGLRLEGKLVLVVGAGPIGARKAEALVAQGARLRVVAPVIGPAMSALNPDERMERAFEPSDLDGVWYVVTATGDSTVDGAVYRAAEERRVFCNAADDPAHCSVILPAVVRRGDITVSISTGGRSPATASWLRRELAAVLDDDVEQVADVATRVRDRMRAAGLATELPGWADVLNSDAKLSISTDGPVEFERRLWNALVEA